MAGGCFVKCILCGAVALCWGWQRMLEFGSILSLICLLFKQAVSLSCSLQLGGRAAGEGITAV